MTEMILYKYICEISYKYIYMKYNMYVKNRLLDPLKVQFMYSAHSSMTGTTEYPPTHKFLLKLQKWKFFLK